MSRFGEAIVNGNGQWSISAKLLWTVNGICFALLIVFVAFEYQRQVHRRLDQQRKSLDEQAWIALVGASQVRGQGLEAIQGFVDQSCGHKHHSHSPGHHIVLQVGTDVWQATSHDRNSEQMLKAIRTAVESPRQLGTVDERELIVGVAKSGAATVFVSQFVDELEEEILRDGMRRVGGLLALALTAAMVVNYVLLRTVVRPLDRLVMLANEIGHGVFGGTADGFETRELNHLAVAMNRMSRTLDENEKEWRSQLLRARCIQRNLLPKSPHLRGATFVAHYTPAEDVAGDFYDVNELGDGSWVVLLADVSGHGIPASLNATLIKAHLVEACERFTDPLAILGHINKRFTPVTMDGDFATAVLVRFIPGKRLLQVVNAGHDAAILLRKDGRLHESQSSGLILGVREDADWTTDEWEVDPGDRLLVLTDGVTEAFNPNSQMLGREVIEELWISQANANLDEAVCQLVQCVENHRAGGRQLDDQTLVAIEFAKP